MSRCRTEPRDSVMAAQSIVSLLSYCCPVVVFGRLRNRRLLLTSINYTMIEFERQPLPRDTNLWTFRYDSDLRADPGFGHICPRPKHCGAILSPQEHNIHTTVPISASTSRPLTCTSPCVIGGSSCGSRGHLTYESWCQNKTRFEP